MEQHYQMLNLNPSADMEAIKASYRSLAKRYHPDAAGSDAGNSVQFQKVHDAYRALLHHDALVSDAEKHRPSAPGYREGATDTRPRWRFEGVAGQGRDVIYTLKVARAAAVDGLKLVLPWKAEDACPRCLGQGHTLAPIFGGPHLRRIPCLKCQGKGTTERNSTVHINLSPEDISRGSVRLSGLGHYRPARGTRGDLVVEIKTAAETHGFSDGVYTA